jgi:large subunit ribosomal protein L25
VAEIKLSAEIRNEFGKGAARRIRRADKVPAVLYGHGSDPVHVTLPGHELVLALKNSNALLSIDVESDNHLAIPKQVQRDPIKGFIEHADLLIVKRGEKVTIDVPVHVEGDAVGGTHVVLENAHLSVEAVATNNPEAFTLRVEGLDAGSQVLAKDINLPTGVSLAVDEDLLIVNVTAAATAEQVEAELSEAEAEAGIQHEPAAGGSEVADAAASADGGATESAPEA